MVSKKHKIGLVKQARLHRVHPDVTSRLIESFLTSLDCPRALAVWLMFVNNEHNQLAELKFDPLNYDSLEKTRSAYLASKYLSKFDSLELDFDKEDAAWAKFSEFENICKETNSRFRSPGSDRLYSGRVVWLHSVVKSKIRKILGRFEPEEWLQSCAWGPGSTSLIKRREASHSRKFQSETGMTRDLYDFIPFSTFGVAYPLWAREIEDRGNPFPNFCVGNKGITVPKDSKEDRVIAAEPGINLWFQKGIGAMIESRLLRAGVNLHDQNVNQKMAHLGSLTGELSTVDLSSASDSISIELVRELLPSCWFEVMDSCRSHYGDIKGVWKKMEKFSSMGNGFTFPLESLIFFSAAEAAAEFVGSDHRVNVYGDDVVIPTSAFEAFTDLLTYYGFRINRAKSYSTSWFRESCGSHWYRGIDIKPVYLKSRLSSVLSVYRAANGIRRLAHRSCASMACDTTFKLPFDLLVSSVPGPLRIRIPETLGDGGFISNFDEATPGVLRARCNRTAGYNALQLTVQVDLIHDETPGYLLARLWQMPVRDPARVKVLHPTALHSTKQLWSLGVSLIEWDGYNQIPSHQQRLVKTLSVVQQWYDLGPWI
jgi:hypothetical protein